MLALTHHRRTLTWHTPTTPRLAELMPSPPEAMPKTIPIPVPLNLRNTRPKAQNDTNIPFVILPTRLSLSRLHSQTGIYRSWQRMTDPH
jgi:hypothetical protein